MVGRHKAAMARAQKKVAYRPRQPDGMGEEARSVVPRESIGLARQDRRNPLYADAPKLLPQLADRLACLMAVLASEGVTVRRALPPFRQETDTAFRASEVLGDAVFSEHI